MSDPNMDQAATKDAAPDEGAGTPESKLNMGTAVVGGPVETGDEPGSGSSDSSDDIVVDPDTGLPVGGTNVP
jgi:hypothetical protein